MIKCLMGGCPEGKSVCCEYCDDECESRCTEKSTGCKYAEPENQLLVFEDKASLIIKSIENICVQKKILEEQEKEMREKLEMAMCDYDVKSFENDKLKITYVEATTKESFDSTKFKKEHPEMVKDYMKTTNVKASIRITLKDGE